MRESNHARIEAGSSTGMTYAEWIKQFKQKHKEWADNIGSLSGLAGLAVREMGKAFPELRAARGWVRANIVDVQTGEIFAAHSQHWWCVDPDGCVVDPVGPPFGHCQDIVYDESQDDKPHKQASDKCTFCGSWIKLNKLHCDGRCEAKPSSS